MYWLRRIRRHLLLASLGVGVTAAVYALFPASDRLQKLSIGSAYAGLGFLGGALVLGPWNVLRRRPNPVSTDLRRDVGIWAALLGVFHTVIGLQVHFRGRVWLYFVFEAEQRPVLPLRYDLFGFANYTGLFASLVLLMLLALSNDLSLRRLGTARWKGLQRWNYACGLLIVAHGIAYQFIEDRALGFVAFFGLLVIVTGVLQFMGFRKTAAGP